MDSDLYEAWCDWKDLDFEGRPERDSRAVRVSPFKIDAAVAALGHRVLADGLPRLGVDVLRLDDVFLVLEGERLARGLDAMDPERRARHVKFFLSRQNPDGGFRGRDVEFDLDIVHGAAL